MPKVGGVQNGSKLPNGKPAAAIDRISASLLPLAVGIDTLTFDPMNARLHPERNMEAIKASLSLYGQLKPVVVRRSNRVVVAGNGTLAAARALGWTKLAATFEDFDDVSAAGYGLADNKTAELARWDFEVVAKLEALMAEVGHDAVGWSAEELSAMRGGVQPPMDQVDGLWQGMPEFDQQDQTSLRHVVVHFKTEEDFLDFLRRMEQEPGDVRQKSIWHPKAEIGRFADKRYAAGGA